MLRESGTEHTRTSGGFRRAQLCGLSGQKDVTSWIRLCRATHPLVAVQNRLLPLNCKVMNTLHMRLHCTVFARSCTWSRAIESLRSPSHRILPWLRGCREAFYRVDVSTFLLPSGASRCSPPRLAVATGPTRLAQVLLAVHGAHGMVFARSIVLGLAAVSACDDWCATVEDVEHMCSAVSL